MLTAQALREPPSLTQFAFARLLEWLDDGVDSRGATYLEMRRRLVWYFDRRGRPAADELADETFNRIARTLEQAGVIRTRPPARYCFVVAEFVMFEDIRRDRRHVRVDNPRRFEAFLDRRVPVVDADHSLTERREQRHACLDRCLEALGDEQRDLAIEYYRDARRERIERRRALAARLGISMNALAIRACRIRDTLKKCVEACGRMD